MSRCTKPSKFDKLHEDISKTIELSPHQVSSIRQIFFHCDLSREKTKEKIMKRTKNVRDALKRTNKTRHPMIHYMEMIQFLNTASKKDWDKLTMRT